MKVDLENNIGCIDLTSAHTLLMGHRPEKLTPEKLSDKLINKGGESELLSFGLFETATPNYSTYYPDVSAEDLDPKDEEFIYPVFRLLSETIVSKYSPLDFSKKGVLKKSMKMLLGQTINIDHEVAVGNAIGAVSDVYWQESYKSKDGVVIPAGINGTFKIDGKSNPRIARGIMMKPPSIHSNSVTVKFKWEPSHTYENKYEFFDKVGTYDKDGELVRLIVTEILNYHETSLVSHGADVYAQKVDDNGNINNTKYAERSKSFSADNPINGNFTLDYKTSSFEFSKDNSIPKSSNNNDKIHKIHLTMKELIEKLTTELGFKDGDLTEENIQDKLVSTFKAKTDKVTALKADKTDLQTKLDKKVNEVTALTEEKEELEKKDGHYKKALKSTQDEAVKLYKLCKGDKADENIVNLIQESNIETAASFVKQYQEEVDEKFVASCKDCNSTNIDRKLAQTSKDGVVNGDGGKTDEEGFEELTDAQVRSKIKSGTKRSILLDKQNRKRA